MIHFPTPALIQINNEIWNHPVLTSNSEAKNCPVCTQEEKQCSAYSKEYELLQGLHSWAENLVFTIPEMKFVVPRIINRNNAMDATVFLPELCLLYFFSYAVWMHISAAAITCERQKLYIFSGEKSRHFNDQRCVKLCDSNSSTLFLWNLD